MFSSRRKAFSLTDKINTSIKVLCDIIRFAPEQRGRFVSQTEILSKFDSHGNSKFFFFTLLLSCSTALLLGLILLP